MNNEILSVTGVLLSLSLNKSIQCADPYADPQIAPFIFLATTLTSSCYTYPRTAAFFMVFIGLH